MQTGFPIWKPSTPRRMAIRPPCAARCWQPPPGHATWAISARTSSASLARSRGWRKGRREHECSGSRTAWRGSPPRSAATVITRTRDVCLAGVPLLSDRQPSRLRVEARGSGNPSIWLHRTSTSLAWINVRVSGRCPGGIRRHGGKSGCDGKSPGVVPKASARAGSEKWASRVDGSAGPGIGPCVDERLEWRCGLGWAQSLA